MKKEYLDRIKFTSKDKFLIDEEIAVHLTKKDGKRIFTLEESKKCFEKEELLFDYVNNKKSSNQQNKDDEKIEEMTDTGSVGGGYEGPGLQFSQEAKNTMKKRTSYPYTSVVEEIEKLVKYALIEEFVKGNTAYDLTEKYREMNRKNSQEFLDEVEKGINIVYAHIFPAQVKNYYQDQADYNGDGIPNHSKENATNLDLRYDGASERFKEMQTAELSKTKSGQEMMATAQKKAEVKDANPANNDMVQMGSDIEFVPETPQPPAEKQGGLQRGQIALLGFMPLKEGQHFKFKFTKKDFENRSVLTESIPSKVKQEGLLFEMEDEFGNNYKMKWENGTAQILEYKNLIKEEKDNKRLNKLFNYSSPNTKSQRLPAKDPIKKVDL